MIPPVAPGDGRRFVLKSPTLPPSAPGVAGGGARRVRPVASASPSCPSRLPAPPPQWYSPGRCAAAALTPDQTAGCRGGGERREPDRRELPLLPEPERACGGRPGRGGPPASRPAASLLRVQSPHRSSRLLCPVCPPRGPEGAHPTLLVCPGRARRARLQLPGRPFPDANGVSFLPVQIPSATCRTSRRKCL